MYSRYTMKYHGNITWIFLVKLKIFTNMKITFYDDISKVKLMTVNTEIVNKIKLVYLTF